MKTLDYVRPLSTKVLFSGALALYRRHFWTLFAINGLYALVTFGAQMLEVESTGGFPLQTAVTWAAILAQLIVIAATVAAASNAVLGRPVSLRASLRRAASVPTLLELLILSIPALVWSAAYRALLGNTGEMFFQFSQGTVSALTVFLITAASALGLLALRILLDVILLFGPPVSVLEKRGPMGTLARVVGLFRSNAGRVLLNYGLLWAIPLAVLHLVLYFPIALLLAGLSLARAGLTVENIYSIGLSVGTTTSLVVYMLISLFLNPITSLLFTLLYYDTRARKENYQEELLAEEMGYKPLVEMMAV